MAGSGQHQKQAGKITWHPGERERIAIREAKKLVHDAHTSGQAAQDALRNLEARIHVIQATDSSPELQKLVERLQHLHRRFNGMELGALTIRVGNAMDEAWRRLP